MIQIFINKMALAVNIEQFRLVDGYDNYQVSSHGRVRNSVTGKILTPNTYRSYHHVKLYKDGIQKSIDIHRLVAFAFCINPNNYNIIDHVDRNKNNNMFNNLRWCTLSENQRNRTKAKNNTSGVQGVQKTKKSWRAQWTDNR